MRKVAVFGEALIDFVPLEKGLPLKDVPAFWRRAGGAPANVAAAIGRLGGRSAFIGQVGDDAFGRHIREVLVSCGVDTSSLVMTARYPTAMAFVTLRSDGERDFAFVRGESADLRLAEEDVLPGDWEDAGWFHFGSNLFMDDQAYRLSQTLIRRARERGMLVSYDPNLRPPLWPMERVDTERVLAVLDQVDLLKVSGEELLALTGLPPDDDQLPQAAEMLAARGPRLIVVTLGAEGCWYWLAAEGSAEARTGRVYSLPVQPVDTTGAGDAFVGALLCQLAASGVTALHDLPTAELERILRFASACGALTTLKPGAVDGLPSRGDVERALAGAD